MKQFIYLMIPVLFCSSLFAQKELFIFIQQPSGQPFYVRMGERSFSSTAGGHIILGGLQDSSYRLYVGFAGNSIREQLFLVSLQHKDRGFELRSEQGEWELSDLQTGQSIKGTAGAAAPVNISGEKKTDPYSQLMAGVVDDSVVLYQGTAARMDAKKEIVKPPDTVVLRQEPAAVAKADTVKKADTAKIPQPAPGLARVAQAGGIVRYGSENVDEGRKIIYIDRTAPAADTIQILIPRL